MNPSFAINTLIEPANMNGRTILGKIILGSIIGLLVSFIIFMTTLLLGADLFLTNPLLPLILLFVAFITTFFGNIIIASLYSLFMSKTYYDLSKMLILLLRTNVILFLGLAPLYMVFHQPSNATYVLYVLAFHVLFSLFISSVMIETSRNPNYTGSAIIGGMGGFCLCLLIYGIVNMTVSQGGGTESQQLLLLLPPLCGYTLMPLSHSLRDIIYYKLYQLGNNPLYIPSLNEVMTNESEASANVVSHDDVNVSL